MRKVQIASKCDLFQNLKNDLENRSYLIYYQTFFLPVSSWKDQRNYKALLFSPYTKLKISIIIEIMFIQNFIKNNNKLLNEQLFFI